MTDEQHDGEAKRNMRHERLFLSVIVLLLLVIPWMWSIALMSEVHELQRACAGKQQVKDPYLLEVERVNKAVRCVMACRPERGDIGVNGSCFCVDNNFKVMRIATV